MPATGGWDSGTIVEAVLAKKSSGGGVCWSKTMPEVVQETIALLDQVARDGNNHKINRAELRRQITAMVGEEDAPSREAIGRHFRGECACAIYRQG